MARRLRAPSWKGSLGRRKELGWGLSVCAPELGLDSVRGRRTPGSDSWERSGGVGANAALALLE